MKKIGLTGGIASGKSTVADFFQDLGVPLINTDEISRKLSTEDLETIDKIAKKFGTQILQNGKINRTKLKKIVFSNIDKRKSLERILHPKIKNQMLRQIAKLEAPYVLIEVPLLFEVGWDKHMDKVLLTTAPLTVRIERLIKRDKINLTLAKKIICAQTDDTYKKKFADDVLNTDQSFRKLKASILNLHHQYLQR